LILRTGTAGRCQTPYDAVLEPELAQRQTETVLPAFYWLARLDTKIGESGWTGSSNIKKGVVVVSLEFQLKAPYQAYGDQPEVSEWWRYLKGERDQVLLGQTGPESSFTIACDPATSNAGMVREHNKKLADQLYANSRNFSR
jgi:hypothetical protein